MKKTKLFLVKEGNLSFLKSLFEDLLKKDFLCIRWVSRENLILTLEKERCDILLIDVHSCDETTIKKCISLKPHLFILLIAENSEEDRFVHVIDCLRSNGVYFDILFPFYSFDLILNKIKNYCELLKGLKVLQRYKTFEQIVFTHLNSIGSWNLGSSYRFLISQLEKCFFNSIGVILEFDPSTKTFSVKSFNRKEKFKDLITHEDILYLHKSFFEPHKAKLISLSENLENEVLNKFENFKSLIVIPLKVKNELYGTFMLLSYDLLCEEDLSFLESICQVISFMRSYINLTGKLENISEDFNLIQQNTSHQERLRSLGQMASGIAHDLNNVITPLIGFSQLLLEKETHISNKGKQYLQHIIKAGEDIKNIISRLRQFYRKKDELDEQFSLIDIHKLIMEAIDLTKPKWKDISQEKGITIEIEVLVCDDELQIIGIASEIREALINLIINSVDALPEGGKIYIRTKKVEDYAVIEVEDKGIGMDGHILERCIEPFFTTKGKEGTGLGLSIVYGIVERHGGRMEIKSEKYKGTIIRLYFPISKDKKELNGNEKRGNERKRGIPKLWILHIDDDKAILRVVKDMLEEDGHRVKLCSDPKEGVEIFKNALQKEPFDLVITDLGMPHMEGKKVASTIKNLSPNTPVVLLTGWDIKEEDFKALGIDYILKKPISFYDLRKAIEELCFKGVLRGIYDENSFSIEPKG